MFSKSAPLSIFRWTFFPLLIATILTIASQSSAWANAKYAAFVYDVNAGRTLFSRSADRLRYPASLTKMMTLYMVFDAIDAGRISLNTRMKVSKRAASMPPSKLYLKAGSTIRVKDAILALVTKSANDVAVVVAEHLGGSETKFARKMTRKARSIGMKSTTFKNASGLPNSKQRTTARDMARLGLSLRERHPRSFRYFATRSFKYGKYTYRNHNKLLRTVKGVNGIKTGYIRASGFNLVTNVENNGRHLIAVVMGGKTGRARDAHMASLIKRNLKKASRKKRFNKSSPLLVASLPTPPKPVAKPEAPSITNSVPVASLSTETPSAENIQQTAVAKTVVAEPIEQGSTNQPVTPIKPKIVRTTLISATTTPTLAAAQPSNTPQSRTTKIAKSAPQQQPATQAQASPAQTASEKRDGWKIQISASPDLEAAEKLLEQAYKRGARVLARKEPYTEPVKTSSGTLYRVRFAGFDDKKTARNACAYMKKRNYKCIAVN
ncbi:MAG: D-alanyl-D-alanine carboxypeptidase [Pseudomonadota bacterium]